MSFRVSALVAAVGVFGLAEVTPALAQPQAPVRPRYSSFGNIFSPNRGPVGGAGFGQNQPFVNPIGPQVAGIGGPLGFTYPGQVAFPQVLPGAYGAIDPQLPPTGVVGTFRNYGHWYGTGAVGYYGHWYPNGVASGLGILGGGGGGSYAGGGFVGGAGLVGGVRSGGSLLGTGLTGGAAINQFRR